MDDKHSSSGGTGTGTGDLELYQSSDGLIQLEVHADGDTVWLTRQQMATLFGRDVKTIGRHVTNALRKELSRMPVVANFATTASDGKTYQVKHYSLDMVLSVGYRVKSTEGIRFRHWANHILHRYLIQGAALNEQRLQQLSQVVTILSRSSDELVAGTEDVLSTYLPSLELLRDYDAGAISASPSSQSALLRHPNQRFSVIPEQPLFRHLERSREISAVGIQ
ncbi:virulence RhuM family protein [Bifidobacterium aquikefiri]|mgnify:CR=1 FL=1|uniref:virulence RhuM family protein n=1 Tax=Bifidobacterium aquikefiri TaxID=1653207 RepID=UPI0023F4EF82|nr:RhuM family protein [Bifidobacterium aquikefiri]